MIQKWFRQAKLGIFIHWGIYAVDGIPESWSIGTGFYSYDDYMKQLDGFTASDYDPEEWASLIKRSGANYAVLTTKHHDGVALFDTKYTDLNVVKKTPAARDLVAPYCDALRKEGIKVGLYFSNTDWSDSDHFRVVLDCSEEELNNWHHQKTDYASRWRAVKSTEEALPEESIPENPDFKECWKRFMERYKGEISELLTQYGTIDLLWFDVMLERKGYSWESKDVKDMILGFNPDIVVNSRLGAYGDYLTPEMYIPLAPIDEPWELCTTFNDSWGFRFNDQNYKDIRQIVRILCECISKGGNLLISLGPDASGKIPEAIKEKMLELGTWTEKYAEAIYPTLKGIGPEYFLGGSTLTEDRKTLYLFVYDCSTGRLMLNGVRNKIRSVISMTSRHELSYRVIGGAPWLNIPGCIWIDLTSPDIDDICTVIKIEFDEPIDLVDLSHNAESLGEQ